MFSEPKNTPEAFVMTPFKTQGIVGYEPRYFSDEIYSMPNAKASPYVLYGSNAPTISSNDQMQLGFERLLPQMEQLPKTKTITAYQLSNLVSN
jgi:hypothetical protein